MAPLLYLVIPCYNEEEVLPETSGRLLEKMHALIDGGRIAPDSRIVFVNDGSKDQTWALISALHEKTSLVSGINLSRNRGHQNALLAGLLTVAPLCDAAISMDADLQDDIAVIDAMLDSFAQGNDIVYGVREDRAKDSFFKRATAQSFYRLINWMGGGIVYNHADCRLMSRRALEGLSEFREVNLFLRGIVPMIGYQSAIVTYVRAERFAGESKYPLKKMLALALEGITSLSIRPMRMITLLGVLIFAVSILLSVYFLIRYIAGATVTGWTSMVLSIWVLGGLQLLAIGVIGEYIGKVYLETKDRPRFIVETFLHDAPETGDQSH